MCAQFMLKANLKALARKFSAILLCEEEAEEKVILPHNRAACLLQAEKDREIRYMNFSLVPSWSKEARPKFATHNARLDSIDAKATWKVPFLRNHCLVPLTHFIEPIYTGEYAGNMLSFFQRNNEPLWASAIYDRWKAADGKFLDSFAIVTDDASDFIRKIGHERQPIFIREECIDSWLTPSGKNALELKQELISFKAQPEFSCAIHRAMKPGWEKRIK